MITQECFSLPHEAVKYCVAAKDWIAHRAVEMRPKKKRGHMAKKMQKKEEAGNVEQTKQRLELGADLRFLCPHSLMRRQQQRAPALRVLQ